MKYTRMRLLTVLSVLLLAAIACNFPISVSGPQRPPTTVPLSTQEVQQLEQNLVATMENPAPSGDVTITITEQQLNSFMLAELANQPDQTIQKPQVHLTDGKMEVYGEVSQSGISTDAKIVLTPYVDANGEPKMNIKSINLGAIPVPDSIKNRLESNVDNLVQEYMQSGNQQFKVKDIVITEGQMTITGEPQP